MGDAGTPPNALLREAAGLLEGGHAEAALERIERALEATPDDAAIHGLRGDALRTLDRLDDALDAYRHAATLRPGSCEFLANAGVAALLLEHHAEAAELLARAARDIRDPRLLHLLSQAERGAGRPDRAEQALEEAIDLAPGFADARVDLGVLLRARGATEAAQAAWRRALESSPDHVAAHFNLANAARDRMALPDAIAGYERVLVLDPGHRGATFNRANALGEQGDIEGAVAGYRALLEGTPSHLGAATNLAAVLLEDARYAEAMAACEQALAHHPDAPVPASLLARARSKQIAGWHFDMLADRGRNEKYRAAIERAVHPGCRVLDIGTGSGLLAMFAARAGAAEVVACELSSPIAAAATQVVRDNELEDRIRIVNARSTALEIGAGMTGPADVVVHEIFDVGLLGEGVLPSLRHAVARLAAPGARVVPRAAGVWARLVRLPRLRAVHPLRELCGLDLSAFDRFRDPSTHTQVWLPGEPHAWLSDPFAVTEVAFDPPPPPVSDDRPEQRSFTVPATTNGEVHAIAFWFDLDFGDGVRASSGPAGELDHWGQAVQFLPPGIEVDCGTWLRVDAARSDRHFRFKVTVVEDPGVLAAAQA